MKFIFYGCCLVFLVPRMAVAQIVINEICSANSDVNVDPRYGNFSGWIELYNKSLVPSDIGGFYLSDNVGQKNKWQIPFGTRIGGKGYLIIWCDSNDSGLHANFALDSDGETLLLSNRTGQQLDYIEFPKQMTNISFGRTRDAGSLWGYLTHPTPGSVNLSSTATHPLDKPTINLNSGRHSGVQNIAVSHSVNNVDLRITTDGSEPSSTSPRYDLPIPLSRTTTVKVKAFHPGFLPSETEVKTLFIDEHEFSLPVVSISTTPDYLWDNTIGIYTDGTNGVPGNCWDSPVNWNQDWYRHAVMEYFDESGSRQFHQPVDIRIGGACSRTFPQKSFAIKARDKYGKNTIDEALFPGKTINQFGGFLLRNSGNDFYSTMFRDALFQSLVVGQMDIDYMAYQPAIFYLNGDYWGIQNLREKIDADYIESNYSIKKNDLDLIETWGNALEGSIDYFSIYIDSLQKINRADPNSFDFIDRHIDVQEYINYLSAEIYYCNTDWPGNNVKFWRQRSTAGKFRWILWDLDFGFALYSGQSYATHPTLEFATQDSHNNWPNPAWATLHTRLLLDNPVFKSRFIQTLTTAMTTTFSPERIIEHIDTFQNKIATEMPYHTQRWGQSLTGWNSEVQRLRDFATARHDFMMSHVADFFGLDETVSISFKASPEDAGSFDFNGVVTPGVEDVSYYKGMPYKISPVPGPGFAFGHWKIKKRESTTIRLIEKGKNWQYFDLGLAPDSDWTSVAFNDSGWNSGNAQLGYGDGDEQTVLNFGGNPGNKFITSYFRHSFSIADTVGFQDLKAGILFDDGVAVYLNGQELYRNNLPGGVINYGSFALQAIPTENVFTSFVIPKGIVKPGLNVIAVEVHQVSPQSSDISFDFELSTVVMGSEISFTSPMLILSDTAFTNIDFEAVFDSVTPIQGVVINEFSSTRSRVEDEFSEREDWIELHNTGPSSIDLADLFITDNTAMKKKHKILPGRGDETILPSGGYKVLWADDDTQQGPLHLNFKLSAVGEEIGIYQQVGYTVNALAEVSFGMQPEWVSYSRIPNASGPFLLSSKPTPGAANVLEIPTEIENQAEETIMLYPNPSAGTFFVDATVPLDVVRIYDSRGTLLQQIKNVTADLPLVLPDSQGILIVVIQSGTHTYVKKLVKK